MSRFPTGFGKYILLDRINSGGMAEVFRAKITGMEQFQRLLAIKCMLPPLNEDPQFIDMFVDEAKLASQLNHANIVQIYELGKLDQQLYIAMELVNGRDLRHVIATAQNLNQPIPFGFAAYVTAKAAEGLDFAHRKRGVDGQPLNLIHRDVSPQNILISYDGEVKITDFGIAKAEERATRTRTGVLKGKFSYMAPEQAMGRHIDHRIDIFALGSLLYETLTGQQLFRGDSDLSTLYRVRKATVPDFAKRIPGIPEELESVLRIALAQRPSRRFAWASEFAEALEPLLIEGRSIFGAKKAREFMHSLYADEISTFQEQLRRYGAVTEDDCDRQSIIGEGRRDSEVYESSFGAATTAPAEPKPMGRYGTVLTKQSEEKLGKDSWDARAHDGHGVFPLHEESTLDEGGLQPGVAAVIPFPAPRATSERRYYVDPPANAEIIDDRAGPEPWPRLPSGGSLRFFDEGPSAGAVDDMAMAGLSTGGAMPGLPDTEMERCVSAIPARPLPRMVPYFLAGGMSALVIAMFVIFTLLPQRNTALHDDLATTATELDEGLISTAAPPAPPGPPPATASRAPGAMTSAAEPPRPAVQGAPQNVAVENAVADHAVDRNGDVAAEDFPSALGASKGKLKRKIRAGRFGFLSVKAHGVRAADIYIDGRKAGASPLIFYRLRVGKHKITAVELVSGKRGRFKTETVLIRPTHGRRQPLKLMIPL